MSEKRNTYTAVLKKGLDLASGPFEASPERALDEMNYVYMDGKVRKRPGYTNVVDVPATRYFAISDDGSEPNAVSQNSAPSINGIWEFVAEDGKNHVVCHAGKLLYEITSTGNEAWECEPIAQSVMQKQIAGATEKLPLCYDFENYKSFAWVGAKMLWFLGGNRYMRLRWRAGDQKPTLEPVAESDFAYVPTTTVSIAYQEAKAGQREQLDDTNMLTRWRKNTLITGIGKAEIAESRESVFRYVLDAPLICKDEAKDMASFRIVLYERKPKEE